MKQASSKEKPMLTHEETAELLGIDSDTLYQWRARQRPDQPVFIRYSPKTVRYRRADVLKWLEDHRVSYES